MLKKYFWYVLFAVITISLVFSNVAIRNQRCSEDSSKRFVLIGGKHYPCYENIGN